MKAKTTICSNCSDNLCECTAFEACNAEIALCTKCCIKVVLMVRPMPFGNDYIKALLGQASRKRQGNINGEKIDSFIDWLNPFLESK